MRHELGLDLPERRIGLSAHDFAQLLGADDVILSHAAKVGGAPAVASRFLHRLEAVAGETRWDAAKACRRKICPLRRRARPARQGRADPAAGAEAAARGAAAEAVGHGDRGLAARSLYDLREIHSEAAIRSIPSTCRCRRPTAARRSTMRSAISRKTMPTALPRRPRAARCAASARNHFAPLMERPEARALWWPRFQRIAAWFAGLGAGAARQHRSDRRRDPRRDPDSARQRAHLYAVRARRPHRAPPRRQLRHPRLQDRAAADRQAGAHGAVAAADAGSRDPARGRL